MGLPDPGNLSYNPFEGMRRPPKPGGGGGTSSQSVGGIIGKLINASRANQQSLSSGVDAAAGQSPAEDDLASKIFDLQNAAIDARYGAGASGGGGGAYVPGRPPTLKQYSGPTIEQLQQYINTGAGNVTGSYGNLENYIRNAIPQTQAILAQGGAAQQTGYTQAAQNIQNAIKQGQSAVGAPAGSAGSAAATEQQAKIAEIANRYRDINAQHQMAAAQATNQTEAARQFIGNQLVSGKQEQGNQALMRFVAGGNLKKSQAQLEMDTIAAANKQATDLYNEQENAKKAAIAERAAEKASSNEGKKQAAKLELAAKFLGAEGKAGKGLTGVQGVLAYGNQQGNPQASRSFLKMVADARANAEIQNQKAVADVSGLTKKTTAGEQLQQLMLGTTPDITDQQGMIDLIRNKPELQQLQKYAIWAPQQLYGNKQALEQLYPGYGQASEQWMQRAGKLGANRSQLESKLNEALTKQFKPTFNLKGLQANPADLSIWQNYVKQQQDMSDLYNSMFEIYSGKYGRGL